MFRPTVNTSSIVVSDDHIFADTTARDAYFSSNPSELVDRVPVYITDTSSLQQYVLATTSWLDITPTIQGPQGDKGDTGADGVGVPTGGTTGQILAKNSNDDYDTEWVNNASESIWGSISGTLSNQTDLQNALNAKINSSLKGAISGVAELNESGVVPSDQLPSYVDDVLEYATYADFPTTGSGGVIYFDLDGEKQYRWGGTTYVEITSGGVTLGETSDTAYRGDRGKTAYDHSQVAHAPSNAQKNSDILKSEIEAKLTGEISTHTHADSGVTTFLGLTDTPSAYTDQGGKVVKVNSGGTALEFATESGGGTWGSITGTLSDQTDLQSALDLKLEADDLGAIGYSSVSESATLPVSPDNYDTFEFIGTGTAWTITANAGQYIRMLSALSASGGTISGPTGYESVCLIYLGSNVWSVKWNTGILTVA